MHVTQLERGLIGKYFYTNIYLAHLPLSPSRRFQNSQTLLKFGVQCLQKIFLSRIFLDLVEFTAPTCRQTPHAFTYPGSHSQKPHSQWVCAGQPYSHSFLSKSFFSSSTGFQCLLEFTSDNCWGSSYPSSRRRRRSTHDDEGNSGGGGIGGGTICISGT